MIKDILENIEKKYKKTALMNAETFETFVMEKDDEGNPIYLSIITAKAHKWRPVNVITLKTLKNSNNKQQNHGETTEKSQELARVQTENTQPQISTKIDNKGFLIGYKAEGFWDFKNLHQKCSYQYSGQIHDLLKSIENLIDLMDKNTTKKATIENIIINIYQKKALKHAKKGAVEELININKEIKSRQSQQIVRLKQNQNQIISSKIKFKRKMILVFSLIFVVIFCFFLSINFIQKKGAFAPETNIIYYETSQIDSFINAFEVENNCKIYEFRRDLIKNDLPDNFPVEVVKKVIKIRHDELK